MMSNSRKHIAIGFYRTIGIGLALLLGSVVLLIIALVTSADLSFMGLEIIQS